LARALYTINVRNYLIGLMKQKVVTVYEDVFSESFFYEIDESPIAIKFRCEKVERIMFMKKSNAIKRSSYISQLLEGDSNADLIEIELNTLDGLHVIVCGMMFGYWNWNQVTEENYISLLHNADFLGMDSMLTKLMGQQKKFITVKNLFPRLQEALHLNNRNVCKIVSSRFAEYITRKTYQELVLLLLDFSDQELLCVFLQCGGKFLTTEEFCLICEWCWANNMTQVEIELLPYVDQTMDTKQFQTLLENAIKHSSILAPALCDLIFKPPVDRHILDVSWLTATQQTWLLKFLQENVEKFSHGCVGERIYSSASPSKSEWLEAVKKQSNTVTIIKLYTGRVMGAYSTACHDANQSHTDTYIEDSSAFIFSLSNSFKHSISDPSKAVLLPSFVNEEYLCMGEGGLALNIRGMIVNSSIDKKIALLGRGVARIELMQVYRLEPRPVDYTWRRFDVSDEGWMEMANRLNCSALLSVIIENVTSKETFRLLLEASLKYGDRETTTKPLIEEYSEYMDYSTFAMACKHDCANKANGGGVVDSEI